MAKHPQLSTLNRSKSVGVVEFSAHKLIIFVLLQLVLSPFILITTVDSLNGNMNNNQASIVLSNFGSQRQFDLESSGNAKVNSLKTNCTGDDGFLTIQANATQQKKDGGNSIWQPSKIGVNAERPYDDDLSSIGNASIHNQSQRTISVNDIKRMERETGNFNKDSERVLSRKRRYLIFPPGSSMQLGKIVSYTLFFHIFILVHAS